MSIWAALVGGFVGTLAMTTAMRAATELQFTRIDMPFLLGTALFADRRRAKVAGYALHFLFGLGFALLYYAAFAAIDYASWWLGALFGFVHAAFAGGVLVSILLPLVHPRMGSDVTSADSSPTIEPPGFMLTNYGPRTPLAGLAFHLVYGAIVGAFVSASG